MYNKFDYENWKRKKGKKDPSNKSTRRNKRASLENGYKISRLFWFTSGFKNIISCVL